MDYATYIRVKSELTAQRREMEKREILDAANGWTVQPGMLQRLVSEVYNRFGSEAKREPAKTATVQTDKHLRPASSR